MLVCRLCNKQMNEQPAITIHVDDEDIGTCDTCGGMANEVPGLGWICIKHGIQLIEVGSNQLYHPETVSLWRRLKWAWL